MSRYLALDAELGQVYLASALVKGAAIKLEKALCVPSEGMLTAANAAEFGRRLKEVLKEAGIAPAPVLVSVGRERVVLKEVKYPASVAAAEEPALVRFQVAKELSETGDNVVIDYFTLPSLDADGQRRALAFAIRKDVLAPLRTLCQSAGLKLAGVTPRPFGIAASLMRAVKDGAVTAPESLNAPIAILVRGDKWGELVILRDGQVAFTRSLTGMALNAEAAMLGEIRRNLAVFSGPSAQNQVQALYVAEGDLPGGWAGRVRAGLSIPVQSYDPIAGTETAVPLETRGSFAGLVGLVAMLARSPELPVNFLEPREPKPVSDPNKRLFGMIAAAAAVLLVAGLGYGRYVVSQKKTELAGQFEAKANLEEDLKKLDDVAKRVKGVKDWQDKDVNWLDVLYDLTENFPDPATTEVMQLTASTVKAGEKSATKWVGNIILDLHTSDVSNVTMLQRKISAEGYAVGFPEPKGKDSQRNAGANGKIEHFVLKYQLDHRDPSRYTLELHAPPPEMRGRPARGGGFAGFGGNGFPGFGGDAQGGEQ